jgi:dTDP-4-dehydrorhamnose reductase
VRVLVTGAGGLLGGRLAALLADRGFSVIGTHRRTAPPPGLRSVPVDLTDPGALEALLDTERPEAVVHAAVAQAGQCLEDPDLAEEINARLPGRLGTLCRNRGIRVVGLSTDLVLDGARPFCREEAEARPVSLYGKTKLAGEAALLIADPSAAVARVALVVGRGHGPRMTASEQIVQGLGTGRPLRLFTDEHRTPVDPESLATALALLLRRGGAGRFHLGGPERLTRHELGLRVARVFGLPTGPIEARLRASHAGPEPRAADTSLDSGRARRELGWAPRPLDEALRESRSG